MKTKVMLLIGGLFAYLFWITTALIVPTYETKNAWADSGQSLGNKSFTVWSSKVVTTVAGEQTSTVTVFDFPQRNLACDFLSSNASATGIWQIDGNVGSSATSFMSGYLMSSVTKTAGAIQTVLITNKVFRNVRVKYTLESNAHASNTVTVNCAAIQ